MTTNEIEIKVTLHNVKAYFAIINKKGCTQEEKTQAYNIVLSNDERNIVTDYNGICKHAVNVAKDEECETKLSRELEYFFKVYEQEREVKTRYEGLAFDLQCEVIRKLLTEAVAVLKTVDM
jgi:hypothetical protein